MPCYNHELYVADAIMGVINQTYNNIELIVIDDGSEDRSFLEIKRLANEYGFFCKTRPNNGLSRTLNEMLSLASGKYISLCASDDIYMPDKIKIQVEYMEKYTHFGMCYGKVKCFETFINQSVDFNHTTKQGWLFNDLLHNCFIPAPSTFIKKSVLDELGGFDENLWIEDWDLWLRLSQKYEIGYIDEFFTFYRMHGSNGSRQIFKMYEAEKQILDKYRFHKSYNEVIDHHKLNWFSQLSKDYKREALLYFYPSVKYVLKDSRFIKGLLKLITFR